MTNQSGRITLIEAPQLEDYSQSEHDEISEKLPAVFRYKNIIEQKNSDFSSQIRQKRHRAWLRAAFAIYFDRLSPKEVCEFWSNEADHLLELAWNEAGLSEHPIALFAFGKLGADELNLSSDVDLMLISEGADYPSKKIQTFQSLLQKQTEFGFALRLDFDLRAGGRMGPLVSSVDQFEDYYGNFGNTWERMAFVRLKQVCGDTTVGQRTLGIAKKFSYRRYIDFTLIQEFKELRPQIHNSKRASDEYFNLKLHPGGIRDIELFTHALQIIHGGKISDVQVRQTDAALDSLKKQNLLPANDCEKLREHYWSLRDLENRVQIINDQQTHDLYFNAPDWVNNKTSLDELKKIISSVDEIVSEMIGPVEPKHMLPTSLNEQQAWLKERGFNDHSINSVWPSLIDKKVRSHSEVRDENERLQFLYNFTEEISRLALDQDLALQLLSDFVTATRAKASFFSLLNRDPFPVKDLALLLSASPYLGHLLATRPELMDGFFLKRKDRISGDFEEALNALTDRRLLTELISANEFLSNKDLSLLSQALSNSADDICMKLLEKVQLEFKYENESLNFLSMGKWAGFELGFRSDLDFVFITEKEVTPEAQKLARKVIAALSTRTRGGSIYPIDMRLRPSGKSGPIIVSEKQLAEYLTNSAKAWERQAYLKSRPIKNSQLNAKEIALEKGVTDSELFELKNIRLQLKKENQPKTSDKLCLKYSDGGLVDIEFATQIACLKHHALPEGASTLEAIDVLSKHNNEWADHRVFLKNHYLNLRKIEQLNQLCTSQSGSVLKYDDQNTHRLAKILGSSAEEIKEQLLEGLKECYRQLEELDPALRAR